MSEVPDRDNPQRLRLLRQFADAVLAARAVVDLGQHQNSDPLVERAFDRLGIDDLQFMAPSEKAADALCNIEIGRKIAAVG
jgi:hypothetical protein